MSAGHGGARPGAGRKLTRERFAKPIAAAEKCIADRLPQLIDRFLLLAKDGDYRALAYLVDRIMGKPAQSIEAEVTGAGGGPLTVRVVYDDQIPDPHGNTSEAPRGTGEGAP